MEGEGGGAAQEMGQGTKSLVRGMGVKPTIVPPAQPEKRKQRQCSESLREPAIATCLIVLSKLNGRCASQSVPACASLFRLIPASVFIPRRERQILSPQTAADKMIIDNTSVDAIHCSRWYFRYFHGSNP